VVIDISQDLCNLLFELSNVDRLNILLELRKTPMKLSSVSKRFDFTVPETARNISRLQDTALIAKNVDGSFHLTPYGEEALQLLQGFVFLSKHVEYFTNHTLFALPPEFKIGLGALENCKVINEVTVMLYKIENMICEAEEYVWFVADQVLASALPLAVEAVKRGVEFRKILLRSVNIPESILAQANDPVFERAARAKKFESRHLDKVDVALFISEKEVGAVCFPNLAGKFDYIGFNTTAESAHSWSKSLFSYYWNRATR